MRTRLRLPCRRDRKPGEAVCKEIKAVSGCAALVTEISADMRVHGSRYQAGSMFNKFYVALRKAKDLGVGYWTCCLLLCSPHGLAQRSIGTYCPRVLVKQHFLPLYFGSLLKAKSRCIKQSGQTCFPPQLFSSACSHVAASSWAGSNQASGSRHSQDDFSIVCIVRCWMHNTWDSSALLCVMGVGHFLGSSQESSCKLQYDEILLEE